MGPSAISAQNYIYCACTAQRNVGPYSAVHLEIKEKHFVHLPGMYDSILVAKPPGQSPAARFYRYSTSPISYVSPNATY